MTITATSEGRNATLQLNVVGRLAYVLVESFVTPQSPPSPFLSFSSSGLPMEVVKVGTGRFTIFFPGLDAPADRATAVVVNAAGSATCAAALKAGALPWCRSSST